MVGSGRVGCRAAAASPSPRGAAPCGAAAGVDVAGVEAAGAGCGRRSASRAGADDEPVEVLLLDEVAPPEVGAEP